MAARVYVGNLPFSIDAEQLRALVEQGGHKALDIKVVTDRETGRPRGFAFVEMASADEAQAVISALNGRDVGGRTLTVSMAREREPRGGGPDRRRTEPRRRDLDRRPRAISSGSAKMSHARPDPRRVRASACVWRIARSGWSPALPPRA